MINRSPLLIVSVLVLACGTGSKNGPEADSLAVSTDTTLTKSVASQLENPSQPVADLGGADTLYNVLARKEVMSGEYVGVEVITESFIDISKRPPRSLLAALIQTGEGEYTGLREGQTYTTIHSVLAVFELRDDEYTLFTFADMGDCGGEGLTISSTEGESITLAEGQDGVMIHTKSSESGAGDYGFRKDEVSIFVLLNNVITPVLSTTLEDYQFTSDEQTATAEQTITTTLTVKDEMTNGLYDINLHIATVRTSTVEESEKDKEGEDKENETGDNQVDEVADYKWTGLTYERV